MAFPIASFETVLTFKSLLKPILVLTASESLLHDQVDFLFDLYSFSLSLSSIKWIFLFLIVLQPDVTGCKQLVKLHK